VSPTAPGLNNASGDPGSGARAGVGGRLAWFHCFAGVAGDMVLGALVDAGADPDGVRAVLDRLELPGWTLRVEQVERAGLVATRVVVEVEEQPVARPYRDLADLLERASLPEPVARRSARALGALAAAEAAVHRIPVEEVHLHELGGHDTLVDIVGSAAALAALGVDQVACSPVAVGTGTVSAAHGQLPHPTPAVLSLLAGVPVVGRDTGVELTTPTGAALVATWSDRFGPLPAVVVRRSGYGAGAADLGELPNCVQVVIGDPLVPRPAADEGTVEPMVLVETTVDDVTGEHLATALDRLRRAGAVDAWVAPVVMARGRPGHVVSALVRPELVSQVRVELARETGSLGARLSATDRWAAPRTVAVVDVAGQSVRVKVGPYRVKAEHRDVVAAADRLGWPTPRVAAAAEDAWRAATEAADR
jgi:uncharacterized protein (TIGR00299 family) protein